MTRHEEVRLTTAVLKWLDRQGAATVERLKTTRHSAPGSDAWQLPTRRVTLETRAGTLSVLPRGYWIACSFSDPARAAEALKDDVAARGQLHYGGRWSFFFVPTASVEARLAYFQSLVKPLLLDDPGGDA